jgi:hypothetical protein
MFGWPQRTTHLYWVFQLLVQEGATDTAKRARIANYEIIEVSQI